MDYLQIKSNTVCEVKLMSRSHSISETTDNYDMTILHDDELENTKLATVHRHKKKIPFWANSKFSIFLFFFSNIFIYIEDQLQLAIINQV